ncbi:hypothetical protein Tco_0732524 [Tanacetum coccineum]
MHAYYIEHSIKKLLMVACSGLNRTRGKEGIKILLLSTSCRRFFVVGIYLLSLVLTCPNLSASVCLLESALRLPLFEYVCLNLSASSVCLNMLFVYLCSDLPACSRSSPYLVLHRPGPFVSDLISPCYSLDCIGLRLRLVSSLHSRTLCSAFDFQF